MKYLFFFMLSCVFLLPATGRNTDPGKPMILNKSSMPAAVLHILKGSRGLINISAVEFKNQKYCRAEPQEDFEFDVHFTVMSANVYFSGANFHNEVTKGAIVSNSLDPIRKYMDKCGPGTTVVFDQIKVKGPDNIVRTIDSVSYTLF